MANKQKDRLTGRRIAGKGEPEVLCSNPVRTDQELPYCTTHLILLGMKEPKKRNADAMTTTPNSSSNSNQPPTPNSAPLPPHNYDMQVLFSDF